VVAATFWVTGRAGQPSPQPPAGAPIAEVLTAPDATMLTARLTTGGHATVVMSPRDRMLVFTAAGLRALPASQCYELWLLEPGRERPAGVLGMPSHGMAGPLVATGLRAGDRLGLTVEPASGSQRPTSPMLMALTL
jgi:anti-sigma-K factor RskA